MISNLRSKVGKFQLLVQVLVAGCLSADSKIARVKCNETSWFGKYHINLPLIFLFKNASSHEVHMLGSGCTDSSYHEFVAYSVDMANVRNGFHEVEETQAGISQNFREGFSNLGEVFVEEFHLGALRAQCEED